MLNSSTFTDRIPSWPILRRPVALAALLWIAIHIFVAGSSSGTFGFNVYQARLLVLFAAVVGWADSRRRKQGTFFGNLGVPAWITPITWAVTVSLLELLMAVINA